MEAPDWIDEIGYWSELKIEIVRKYAAAYAAILAKQPLLHPIYVDAFAGGGLNLSETTGGLVEGAALKVLGMQAPFEEYHLIDLDSRRAAMLRELVGRQPMVYVYEGDCNRVLPEKIVPRCQYADYRRALWVLDPKGMHYRWDTVVAAGQTGAVDLLLNFPIMDANRNALWHDAARVTAENRARMDAFWGDGSWAETAYTGQDSLFGDTVPRKLSNRSVVDGYCARLQSVAGFRRVAIPLPMRNYGGAIVYYLLFASQNQVAVKVANDIFRKYGATGIGPESTIEA